MADEDRQDKPEENSEAVTMASEATPPPETETRDLSTPTQDELPQLISSLAPGVSASGIQAATSALRGIPLPTSTNSVKTPPQASGIDEISDSEFNEDDLANEALRPVEISQEIEQNNQRSRSRLSNVSSSDAELGGKKANNADGSDAVSLSGLSSADGEQRLQIRSDVEDGEIPTKPVGNPAEIEEVGRVNGHAHVVHRSESETEDSDPNDKRFVFYFTFSQSVK